MSNAIDSFGFKTNNYNDYSAKFAEINNVNTRKIAIRETHASFRG